uniref:Uncharacterized protein n=1 Tax=Oryza punctata TaxID=4537 RepID=A0A0E0MAY0_ORYPU
MPSSPLLRLPLPGRRAALFLRRRRCANPAAPRRRSGPPRTPATPPTASPLPPLPRPPLRQVRGPRERRRRRRPEALHRLSLTAAAPSAVAGEPPGSGATPARPCLCAGAP